MLPFGDVWFEAADGLKLFARDYNQAPAGRAVILCLAGLTRNSKDFEPVIPHLARRHRVITMDYRGRGRSAHAEEWATYRPEIEASDAVRLLDHLNVPRAAILGTSRGGIVAMVMAAKHIDRLGGVFFNDIGPEIEPAGLIRIRKMIDQRSSMSNWDAAIDTLKAGNPGFETLTAAQWDRMARAIFRDENGQPVHDFDIRLGLTFPSMEDIAGGKVPALWMLFDLLKDLPVSVLRGEHSDLLSQRIVDDMTAHHPAVDAVMVRDRGHVPFLDEPESVAAILRWLDRVDSV